MGGREPDYDVIVAGGGPAGATVATLVAARGLRVTLLERAPEPRFKVGESLMPATYWTFERLGVLDRMKASQFPVKGSVQFFSADGKAASPFYFEDHDPHESSRTWQVLRSEFDQILLENAVEKGVELRRGVSVREVLYDGDRAVGVRTVNKSGSPARITSRVVVDATGQSALIARGRELKQVHPALRQLSFYTHFEGAVRATGRDEGATLIFRTPEKKTWFWYIPLPEDRVSVGVVGPVGHLVKGRDGDPQQVFDEELERCPALQPRLSAARQVLPMHAIRDFSYRSRQIAGDGWVLVGDALGFIDPIYSSGVFLAVKSGEMAADAITEALDQKDPCAERLGRFGPELLRGMDALTRVVDAFYEPGFSFRGFLESYPQCREELVDLLMGNVFRRSVDNLLTALDEISSEGSAESREGVEP